MAGQAAADLVRQAIEQTGSTEIADVCKVLPLLVCVELVQYKRVTQEMVDDLLEKKGITGTKVVEDIIKQVQGKRPTRPRIKHYNGKGQLIKSLGGDVDVFSSTWT